MRTVDLWTPDKSICYSTYSNVVEIHNRIMLDLCPRLPHIYNDNMYM